jgi:hypothetical protein
MYYYNLLRDTACCLSGWREEALPIFGALFHFGLPTSISPSLKQSSNKCVHTNTHYVLKPLLCIVSAGPYP